jgi:hypothetical protein
VIQVNPVVADSQLAQGVALGGEAWRSVEHRAYPIKIPVNPDSPPPRARFGAHRRRLWPDSP